MSSIAIISPANADANNGNYRTAARWQSLLEDEYEVSVNGSYLDADILLALHARRSSPQIQAFKAKNPKRPVVLALTGTDLYKDIPAGDTDALASLAAADALIVLQSDALHYLKPAEQQKARVIYQSVAGKTAEKTAQLSFCAVGHLRAEKDPRTYWQAIKSSSIAAAFTHLGQALDPVLGHEAAELMHADPRFSWLGAVPHEDTLTHIAQSHFMVISSIMEGGAHVVSEAIVCQTPVLASRMSGNIGLLGEDYQGYFEVGNAPALARLMARCTDPEFAATLRQQCQARAYLFDRSEEQRRLRTLINEQ